jgi:hypothetical protein
LIDLSKLIYQYDERKGVDIRSKSSDGVIRGGFFDTGAGGASSEDHSIEQDLHHRPADNPKLQC